MKYVFPYINPDTDGVCAALSYAFLNKDFKPVIFGDFDNETRFVLSAFQMPFPDRVAEIEADSLIVLVDTHHVSQLPKIKLEKVIEVIDHHPGGDDDRMPNAKIQNEEVGAACTLIAEKMKGQNLSPTKEIAGIVAMAIISNTLNFTAPSTSERDKIALNWLRNFVVITDEDITLMFKARSDISAFDTHELLTLNTKVFEIQNQRIGITQLELADIGTLIKRKDFLNMFPKIKNEMKMDHLIFSGVDILKHKTIVVVTDEPTKHIVEKAIGVQIDGSTGVVDKILLRKTDFVPQLQKYFSDKQ